VLAIIAGAVFAVPRLQASFAAATNANCSLQLPNQPLTAQGLATPYQLFATDPAQGPCNEANVNQSAFVQAVIYDPRTSTFSSYEPLVIDRGTQPAILPAMIRLPQGAIVGLWFGFNGTFLHLAGDTANGHCINGSAASDFGQFAYCNAPQFFRAANDAIRDHRLTVPALGTAKDGQACPTTRSFSIVDMDQSDNVQTQYLATGNGQIAQLSAANQARLNGGIKLTNVLTKKPIKPKPQNTTTLGNPSDNALVSRVLDPILGCAAWTIPDLANNGTRTATMATDELQAAANQQAPVALVPAGDEMVLLNNQPNLMKTNAYRLGVDQPVANTLNDADTKAYCTNLVNISPAHLNLDKQLFMNQPSPDGGATANSLFTFLANRLNASLGTGGLNCVGLLNIPNPVTLVTDGNGVVTNATIATTGTGTGTGTGMGTGTGTGTGTAPNCVVDGTNIPGCAGTVTINGKTCTLSFANGTVTEACNGTNTGTGTGTGMGTGTGTAQVQVPLDYNNIGISNDGTRNGGNFDSAGYSYSAQALAIAGITPGGTVTFNGVSFIWPKPAAGQPDNVQVKGQVVPIPPTKGASTLAFLGSSGFGPSTGTATINYTDGTTQDFTLAFSDWTLLGGGETPLNGNQVVASTGYRNRPNGTMQMQGQLPTILYEGVSLAAGKTVKSVTLPNHLDHGNLHIFAISTK
jgi:hypothetical protein